MSSGERDLDTGSLRGRQVASLRQMLRFNQSQGLTSANGAGSAAASAPSWKLLLFDRVGQDLLSPTLNVKALRDEGVTLHLLIQTDR